MIRSDYLMRTIEQLAGVFAKLIAKRKREVAPEEIRLELEERLAEFMKTRRAFLYTQDIELVDGYDPRVAAEVGRLWALNAEVAHENGDAGASSASIAWAIRTLTRALTPAETSWSLIAEKHLFAALKSASCAAWADREDVAAAYGELFDYAAATMHLERAEDALFAGLELGEPSLAARGVAFFEGLDALEDDALEAGGLSRAEIAAILSELRS